MKIPHFGVETSKFILSVNNPNGSSLSTLDNHLLNRFGKKMKNDYDIGSRQADNILARIVPKNENC